MVWYKEEFTISTDKSNLSLEYIHDYLSNQSYWAKGIPFDIVKRSVEGAMCFGVYTNGQQIGFARVITDAATFAYLADVFIDEAWRGRGLSKWLMEVILSHPDLQDLRGFMLATRDAHELYRKFGFTDIDNPGRFMRKANPDIYKKPEA